MRKYMDKISEKFFSRLFNEKGEINGSEGTFFFGASGVYMYATGRAFMVINNLLTKGLFILLFSASMILWISAVVYGEKKSSEWKKDMKEKRKSYTS